MSYEQMDLYALRRDFKKHHFECGPDQFSSLCKMFHASNMLYKLTSDIHNLCPMAQDFYKFYQSTILNQIKKDFKIIPTIEYKHCRDLIQMEYMQKSKNFYNEFVKLEKYLLDKVNRYGSDIKQGGIPKHVPHDFLTEGESCFILCFHPELANIIQYMRHDMLLTDNMRKAIETGNKKTNTKNSKQDKKITISSDFLERFVNSARARSVYGR